MRGSVGSIAAVLGIGVVAWGAPEAAHARPVAPVVVEVYATATLAPGERDAAWRAGRAALATASIASRWCEGAREGDADGCASAPGRRLIVRIADAGTASTAPGRLGYALVDPVARGGTLATVFADRVREAAAAARADGGRLLGLAIAHEIGHLLLGTNAHVERGLMRPVWLSEEIRRDAPGDWMWTAGLPAAMRRGLERSAGQGRLAGEPVQ